MRKVRNVHTKWIVATLVGLLLVPTVVYAFNGSYSPTGHWVGVYEHSSLVCPGRINDEVGGSSKNDIVEIRTTMNWNPDHAQNVRDYSSGGEYYTHDITDVSDHLNGWCLWTNFPSPYYDWDDDDDDDKWEESEVVAVDTSFPVDNQYYSVNSYFTRWAWVCHWQWWPPGWDCSWEYDGGSGNVEITPAVSKWQGWPVYEYQTTHYDGDPVIVSYGSKSLGGGTARQVSDVQVTQLLSISLGEDGQYTATIAMAGSRVFLNKLDIPARETEGLLEYSAWSRRLTEKLRQAGLEKAEVVVTFDRHITPREFMTLVDDYQLDVNVVHAEYTEVDEKGNQQVWTSYTRNLPGTDFGLLNEAAQKVANVDLAQPHGVVAVYGTTSIEQVDRLNQAPRVFLADPIASYVSLVASQHSEVQEALHTTLIEKRDGLYQQIVASAESTAQKHGQQVQDLLAPVDVEQVITEFFDQHPEQIPHVEVQVHDLWNVLIESQDKSNR
ncbi:MAG: hypothetical protein SXV54_19950 [Chloroflexota bacterium]|nr:hypothetical protein [Chloroflexota bacterium]